MVPFWEFRYYQWLKKFLKTSRQTQKHLSSMKVGEICWIQTTTKTNKGNCSCVNILVFLVMASSVVHHIKKLLNSQGYCFHAADLMLNKMGEVSAPWFCKAIKKIHFRNIKSKNSPEVKLTRWGVFVQLWYGGGAWRSHSNPDSCALPDTRPDQHSGSDPPLLSPGRKGTVKATTSKKYNL